MRRQLLLVLTILAVAAAALASPMQASAANEYGSTSKWPWSGYWWPMLENGYNLYTANGPLQKYDQYVYQTTGAMGQSQAWEKANHSTKDPANSWWGYCHAWSSAAILAPEPQAVTRNGVNFSTNDVKGLTTALYYEPTFAWLSGTRVDDTRDNSSAAFRDIAPAWMDYLLRYYVRYYKYPFIMDVNADSQVWNYPVFAYSRDSTFDAAGVETVSTTVWYSSPDWNATGTKYFSKHYSYVLQAGTLGSWTGASVLDHPDFAWVPTGKTAGASTNPYVTSSRVWAITGLSN
ncbi:MAG: hypothetical protein JWN41_944 [Thermoleophilia bacterium]|nr:hypothetical protein [Thermoleophilia bacterium]